MPTQYWGIRAFGTNTPTVTGTLARTLGALTSTATGTFTGAWTPTSVAGLKLWLDASDASTFSYSSGVLVSQWNDKSGTGNHLVQNTSTIQPSRNGTQNSLTTVVFAAATFRAMAVAVATGLSGAGTTVLIAFKMNSGCPTYGTMVSLQPTTGSVYAQAGGFLFLRNLGNNGIESYRTSVDRSIKATTMGAWHQGTCLYDGTNNIVYVDGSAGSTVAYSPALAATRIFVGQSGGGEYFDGEIAEILVYDTGLNSTDRGLAEAYLKAKWGTP